MLLRMEPDFWRQRWRDDQIGFHKPEVNAALAEHWPTLGVALEATVLVPLCGKSVDMAWLAARGHPVIGVELSEIAARAFYAEQQIESVERDAGAFLRFHGGVITLYAGDFFDLGPADLGAVGAVYDRAALVAFPASARRRYAAHLARVLPAALPTLLVALEYDPGEMDGPPFPVREEEVRALFGASHRVEPLAASEVLDDEPHLAEKGLTRLTQRTYRLLPAGDRSDQPSTS